MYGWPKIARKVEPDTSLILIARHVLRRSVSTYSLVSQSPARVLVRARGYKEIREPEHELPGGDEQDGHRRNVSSHQIVARLPEGSCRN